MSAYDDFLRKFRQEVRVYQEISRQPLSFNGVRNAKRDAEIAESVGRIIELAYQESEIKDRKGVEMSVEYAIDFCKSYSDEGFIDPYMLLDLLLEYNRFYFDIISSLKK